MNKLIALGLALSGLLVSLAAIAQEHVGARPDLLLRQIVEGMPKGDKQEVSVLTATLKPGEKTPFHMHRFPVTVYILEGAFTLEMEGRPTGHGQSRGVDGGAAERQDDRL